ncbi:hypothetical protein B0H14DRAFT_2831422 [Mycena olivaceomarginata]|nr:hypothetical protein B0H14DRAFT_2831422 [Mycena olivaceomarginata]
MRALSALPLDDDIVDRILTFCPTFTTLQSMILVSKAFYAVFQTHPKSITRAVAYNIVGPALPQALRVIRFPLVNLDGTLRDEKEDPDTLATTLPEEHSPSIITAEEQQVLQENSTVVETLEDIYSLTHKDRTSTTSVLTQEESWRFRRAMYRIWLYCNIFPGNRYTLEDIDFDEDNIKLVQRQRTAVLSEYPTDELLQIYAVVRFMRGILEAVSDEEDNLTTIVDILLSVGPTAVECAWKYQSREAIEDDIEFPLHEVDEDIPLYTGYFSIPLDNIWTARKVKLPKEDEPATKYILDTIIGGNDTCSQCTAPGGLALLTEANWHRIPANPIQFLKNKLKITPTVTTPFNAHFHHVSDNDAIGAWISSIFTVPKAGPEWDGWERDKSYCQPCLCKFLEEHVWRWFLQERINGGWSPPENCWYGYNCKTMVHQRAHAEGKNHLCVPIKGDP